MKTLIKLFSFLFFVCAIFYVFSDVAFAARSSKKDYFNVLVVGFDESPSNTDVLCILSCDVSKKTLKAVQIPRDTYFDYGDKKGKINGLYSHEVLNGATRAEALSMLSDRISDALGVDLDGLIAFSFDGLAETVDFLGGIEISAQDIPIQLRDGFSFDDNGNVLLNGKRSMDFVRYRKGYQRGDLERLDTQKIFLKSLFKKIQTRKDVFSFLKFLSQNDGVFLNVNKGALISFVLGSEMSFSELDFIISTLPGRAIKTDELWYYVINKKEAGALIAEFFSQNHREFDSQNYFIYM